MGIQYPVHDLRDHPWYYAFLIIAKHYFYSFFCLRCGCILVPETFLIKVRTAEDVAWEMAAQGAGYCICFPPENFRNTYGLTVKPLFFPDGTPVMRNTWLYYRRERCNTNLKGFIAYTEAAR